MKVLHLRASNFYGGPERQLHFHARLARESGVDITVSSFMENGHSPQFLEVIKKDNIPVHTFEVSSAYDRSAVEKLAGYLKDSGIDKRWRIVKQSGSQRQGNGGEDGAH